MPEAKMTVEQELDALRGEVWRALEMEGPPPSSEDIAKAVRSAAVGDRFFNNVKSNVLEAEARTEVLSELLDELWKALGEDPTNVSWARESNRILLVRRIRMLLERDDDEHPAVALLGRVAGKAGLDERRDWVANHAELSDRVNVLRIDSDELAFAHETMNEVGAFYGFDARCRWTIEAMGELKRAIQARRNADELEVRAASIRVVREVRKAAEEHYAAHRAVSDVMKKEEGTLGVDYHLHGPGAAAHYAEALRELREERKALNDTLDQIALTVGWGLQVGQPWTPGPRDMLTSSIKAMRKRRDELTKEVEDLKRNAYNLGNLLNGRAHDLQRAADVALEAMVVLSGQVQEIRDLADPLGDDL